LPLQVADLFVLRIAAQQALAQQHRGKLITKSLHAELVYNMSGSRHVSLLNSRHHHAFAEVLLLVAIHSKFIISCSGADIWEFQKIWSDWELQTSASGTLWCRASASMLILIKDCDVHW
jgi:hypothetical protein